MNITYNIGRYPFFEIEKNFHIEKLSAKINPKLICGFQFQFDKHVLLVTSKTTILVEIETITFHK